MEIVGEWTEPCVNAANEQLFRQDPGEFLTLIRATLSVGYFSQAETVIMDACLQRVFINARIKLSAIYRCHEHIARAGRAYNDNFRVGNV